MLNISKIESDFNKHNLTDSDIAKILNKPYTTINNKRKREKNPWTPDEIEKIAEFFKKPISYYFDKEENEIHLNEPAEGYECRNCRKLKRELEDLKERYIKLSDDYRELIKY